VKLSPEAKKELLRQARLRGILARHTKPLPQKVKKPKREDVIEVISRYITESSARKQKPSHLRRAYWKADVALDRAVARGPRRVLAPAGALGGALGAFIGSRGAPRGMRAAMALGGATGGVIGSSLLGKKTRRMLQRSAKSHLKIQAKKRRARFQVKYVPEGITESVARQSRRALKIALDKSKGVKSAGHRERLGRQRRSTYSAAQLRVMGFQFDPKTGSKHRKLLNNLMKNVGARQGNSKAILPRHRKELQLTPDPRRKLPR
jgi:hypothetical protein